jgi:undecaprenyl-diphosphatase
MIIGLFIGFFIPDIFNKRVLFSLMLVINGVITLFPIYLHQGNRDARSLAGSDGFLIGLAGALSAIPGISRNGAIMAMTVIREADKKNAVNWSFMLVAPAMAVMILTDFISIFTVGVGKIVFMTFVGYLVSACAAFVGTYMAVSLIRMIVQRSDYTAFAYYDFGLALFTFIMYIIT